MAEPKQGAAPRRPWHRRLYARVMASLSWRFGITLAWVYYRRGFDPGEPAPAGLEFRALSAAEMRARAGDADLNLARESATDAFLRNGGCIGAFEAGTLVGYSCFACEDAPYGDGVWLRVPPHAAYRYNSIVRPSHRDRGIGSALYRIGDEAAVRGGREYIVGWTYSHNFSSIAASRSCGRRLLGLVLFWRRGERFIALHSPAVRRFGVEFYVRTEIPKT